MRQCRGETDLFLLVFGSRQARIHQTTTKGHFTHKWHATFH
jgi:hypothetical protein